jgi:hypothetical protein
VLSFAVLWVGVLNTRGNARCRVKWLIAVRDGTRLGAWTGGLVRCRGAARRQKALEEGDVAMAG